MGNFTKNNRNRPRTMYSAICSSCGKSCEVPFRPTGDKPVYCRDCFAGRAAMGGDRSKRRDPRAFVQNAAPNNANQQSRTNQQNSGGNDELRKQLEGVNAKLERLISSVQALSQVLTPTKTATTKSAPAKKVAKVVAKKGSKKK